MKKAFRFILPAAALAVLAAGCVKDLEPSFPQNGSPNVEHTFIAMFENGATRTTIGSPVNDSCKVSWASGDVIRWRFNSGSPGSLTLSQACDSIRISPQGPKSFDSFFAVYGNNISIDNCTADSVFISGAIPEVQEAPATAANRFGAAHVSVARALSDTTSKLYFQTVVSILQFSISTQVDSILFYGNNGEILCGTRGIKVGYNDDEPVVSYYGEPRTTITLKTNRKTGTFYIAMLPVDFTSGFKFALFKEGERVGYITSTKHVELERNQVRKITTKIEDSSKYTKDNGIVDLGFNPDGETAETANCYIVPASTGSFKFRADIKGNGNMVSSGIDSEIHKRPFTGSQKYTAEVIYCTRGASSSNFALNSVVSNVRYEDYFIYFDAAGTGSALIALKEPDGTPDGTIVWSWHIWVWPNYNIMSYSDFYYNNAGVLMSRNLGADYTRPYDYNDRRIVGLFYQWGRKDPFVGSDYRSYIAASDHSRTAEATTSGTGTIDYAIKHPWVFLYSSNTSNKDWQYNTGTKKNDLWNSAEKTAFDPCPPGWVIPDTDFWKTAAGNITSTGYVTISKKEDKYSGMYFSGTFTDATGYYPASGYLQGPSNTVTAYMRTSYAFWWTGAVSSTSNGYCMTENYSNSRVTLKASSARHLGGSVRCKLIDPSQATVTVSNVNIQDNGTTCTSLSIDEGTYKTVTAEVLPANATNKDVTWSVTSGTSFVTLQESVVDGVATCKIYGAAPGTAVIKATADGVSGQCTVTVKKLDVIDLNKYTNSSGGTVMKYANCYIVSQAGKEFKFNATVKGNKSGQSVGDVKRCEILWQTYGTSSAPTSNLITIESFSSPYCIFKTPNTLKNGNVVIAAYDATTGGNILWSWHIWVCNGFDPEDTKQVYNNSAGTMMDRNLGATSITPGSIQALGLLYQWGRKDPFPAAGSFSQTAAFAATNPEGIPKVLEHSYGTVENSIKYPDYFIKRSGQEWLLTTDDTLWGTSKTIYDPCPVGWKVPYGGNNASIWTVAYGSNGTISNAANSTNCGHSFSNVFGSFTTWYPYGSYIVDGTLMGQGSGGYGYYWTTTPYSISGRAYVLNNSASDSVSPSSNFNHANAVFVRCMKE